MKRLNEKVINLAGVAVGSELWMLSLSFSFPIWTEPVS